MVWAVFATKNMYQSDKKIENLYSPMLWKGLHVYFPSHSFSSTTVSPPPFPPLFPSSHHYTVCHNRAQPPPAREAKVSPRGEQLGYLSNRQSEHRELLGRKKVSPWRRRPTSSRCFIEKCSRVWTSVFQVLAGSGTRSETKGKSINTGHSWSDDETPALEQLSSVLQLKAVKQSLAVVMIAA